MSVGYTVVIPDSRNRGQGMPVDYLVHFCIEKGITSIGMMYELHRVVRIEDGVIVEDTNVVVEIGSHNDRTITTTNIERTKGAQH